MRPADAAPYVLTDTATPCIEVHCIDDKAAKGMSTSAEPSIERHAVTTKLRYLGIRHDAVLLATAELLRCPESKPLALFWQVYEVKHINLKSLLNLIGKALATIICFYHNQKENLWVSLIPWRVRLASNAGVPLFRPREKTP